MKNILTLRIDQQVKSEIDRLSQEEGVSPSQFSRDILYGHLEYDEEKQEFYDFTQPIETFVINISSIRKDLPQITMWLFVNLYTTSFCTIESLEIAKNILERVTKEPKLSNDLRFEFLKVLNDVNRVLVQGIENNYLMFAQLGNMYSINFSFVFQEVYNIINRDYRDDE